MAKPVQRTGRGLVDSSGLGIDIGPTSWIEAVDLKLNLSDGAGPQYAQFSHITHTGGTDWEEFRGSEAAAVPYGGTNTQPSVFLDGASVGDIVQIEMEGWIDVPANADAPLRFAVGTKVGGVIENVYFDTEAYGIRSGYVDDSNAGSIVRSKCEFEFQLAEDDLLYGGALVVPLLRTANSGDAYVEDNSSDVAVTPWRFRARLRPRRHGTNLIGMGQSLHNTPSYGFGGHTPLTRIRQRSGMQNIGITNIAYSGSTFDQRVWSDPKGIAAAVKGYRNNVVLGFGGYADHATLTGAQLLVVLEARIVAAKAAGVNSWIQLTYPSFSEGRKTLHADWHNGIRQLHADGVIDGVIDCDRDTELGDPDKWLANYTLDGVHWNLAGLDRMIDIGMPIIEPFLI